MLATPIFFFRNNVPLVVSKLYTQSFSSFHCQKLPSSNIFNLSKNKETKKTFHFFTCHDIKMMIMTSYIRIRDGIINFLKFTRFLSIIYSYQVSAWSDLHQKKNGKICLFDHVFSQALPSLIGYHGNSEWPSFYFLLLKDYPYNFHKSHKVWWRSVKPFLRYLAKILGGGGGGGKMQIRLKVV